MAGYYFRLPTLTQLTVSQQAALNESGQIALSGGPGTGKSVVSLYRHINNYGKGKRSLLLTYTTTLARYLSACCRLQNRNAANAVNSAYAGRSQISFGFDEIILDEAQDLDNMYYSSVPTNKVSYGADDSQILYPDHCSKQEDLRRMFPQNVEYVLDKNFRSTLSIMNFAKEVFPNAFIPRSMLDSLRNNVGEKPVYMISNGSDYDATNNGQNQAIINIINEFRSDTHNIAILVPFKNDVKVFKDVLKNEGIDDFSYYYEDKIAFPNGCGEISNVHVTTFKSAKGLEFDTVIIPNFHKKSNICGKYNTDWNDYYVAVTRARSNLYIISNHDSHSVHNVADVTHL